MKRPQPDLEQMYTSSFVNRVGGVRKLKKLWQTTVSDGEEILHPRLYYQPVGARLPPKDFEKITRFLGCYDDLIASTDEGLDSAWLYLNKNKGGGTLPDPAQFATANLNLAFWDPADGVEPEDITLTTTIIIDRVLGTPPGYRGKYNIATTNLLNASMTEDEKIQVIQDNYETLWDTCLIRQYGIGVINKGSYENPVTKETVQDEDDLSPNDPWLAVMAVYALRDNGIPCTIKSVRINVNSIDRTNIRGFGETPPPIIYPIYEVEIEIPTKTFSAGNLVVLDIASDINVSHGSKDTNARYIQRIVKAMSTSDLQEDVSVISRPYQSYEGATSGGDPRFAAIWKNGGIKASAFTDPRSYGLSYRELYNYVFGIVDSGHKKKKIPKWKKALAIIIFIIVVIILAVTLQFEGIPAAWALFYAVAVAVSIAAITISLLSLAASALGDDEWAMAFAHASKQMAPLVTVASIFLIVFGIGQAVNAATTAANEAAKAAAVQAGGTAVAEVTAADVLKDLAVDYVKDMVGEIVKGATDIMAGNLVSANALKFITVLAKVGTMPQENKLKELNSLNNDLSSEYAELTQEMSREYDTLRGFARTYCKPATADQSIFAGTYDLPYERGGGPLAMGCIQRTTKQALRKGTYDDPAFDNILVV